MGDKKGWRSFAGDFLGAAEVSFESFQINEATVTDEAKAATAGSIPPKNIHPSLSPGLQALYEGNQLSRQERTRALQQKMQEQQRRYRRAEERRQQRELDAADAWKKKVDEEHERRVAERTERLEKLQEAQRQVEEAKAQKQAAEEAKKKAEEAEAEEAEQAEMSMFLTGLAAPAMPRQTIVSNTSDTNAHDKTLKPQVTVPSDAEQSQKMTRKPRVPRTIRKKEEKVITTQEKSMVQQLPQLFPGLRRTAEGKMIQEDNSAVDSQQQKNSRQGEDRMIRQAQLSLMKKIAGQVLDYRRSVRPHPVRLIEVVPTGQ